MPPNLERRRHERFGFRVPAHVTHHESDDPLRGYLMNISASGAFVIIDDPIPARSRIRLRFRIQPGTWCEASGVLKRVLPLGRKHAFGVELTERNAGFDFFVRNLSLADELELMSFVRDMGRVYIRVDEPN